MLLASADVLARRASPSTPVPRRARAGARAPRCARIWGRAAESAPLASSAPWEMRSACRNGFVTLFLARASRYPSSYRAACATRPIPGRQRSSG
eukprot:6246245-Pyramimonas_sp.AAC.1